jgi:hypothetical protein
VLGYQRIAPKYKTCVTTKLNRQTHDYKATSVRLSAVLGKGSRTITEVEDMNEQQDSVTFSSEQHRDLPNPQIPGNQKHTDK